MDTGDEPWWERAIRRVVERRRVVLAGGVAQIWTEVAPLMHRLGATGVLVVATEGIGVGPVADDPIVAVEPPPGLSMMELVRFGVATLADPPDDVRRALEAFDPSGDAVVLGIFLNEAPALLGRPFLSHRRPEWVALEDKTVIDAVWDDAGVARAPSVTVPIRDAAASAVAVDRGDGTVWAVDASAGWHGGGHGLRWVVDDDDARRATRELSELGPTVRVMPFLEGIPCSIHGIVAEDGVAALRPVEMVTLRRGRELFYAGCSTYWDPPTDVRESMRALARTVGDHLARRVGYRGAFTVDGVAGADGFVPTELNPRPGAGLSTMGRALPDGFPLLLVVDLIAARVDVGRSIAEIETQLLDAADTARSGGTWRFGGDVGIRLEAGRRWYVDGEWTESETAGAPSAGVVAGPRGVRCGFDPATWPVGPSVAPAAAAFYRHLDEVHGTSFGDLAPALDPFAP